MTQMLRRKYIGFSYLKQCNSLKSYRKEYVHSDGDFWNLKIVQRPRESALTKFKLFDGYKENN